jgi:ABC-type Na+ efflux pump permease subunit
MKKKSILYFLIPVVALLGFIPIYWNYSSHFEDAQAQREATVRQGKLNELKEQDRLRQKAVQDALDAQDRRKKEKAEREALEAKRTEEKEDAVQARAKAQSESRRVGEKVDRLKNDVKVVEDEVAKIQADETGLRTQQGYLEQYVQKAQANVKNLSQVLEKIAAADQAAEAARAAAAAAKKS